MRRLIPFVVAGLVAGSLASPSVASDGTRTVSKPYTITRGQIHASSDTFSWWMGTQPEFFRARAGDRWLDVSLTDGSGNPVAGRVEIDGQELQFCSETQEPVRVSPGDKVAVNAIFGPCDDALSIVTEGTITATFSQ